MPTVKRHPPGDGEARLNQGERVWANLVADVPPLPLHFDRRGLPAGRGSLTLVEAVSWRAFGKAIPHSAWSAASALDRLGRDCVVSMDHLELQAKAGTFRSLRDRIQLSEKRRLSEAVEKLRAAWAAHQLVAQWVPEMASRTGVPATVKIAFQRAEPEFLEALKNGALVCRGHRSDSLEWVDLPADLFGHPVTISMERNVLVPRNPDLPEAKLIAQGISPWSGLQLEVAAVWKISGKSDVHAGRGVSPAKLSKAFEAHRSEMLAAGKLVLEASTLARMKELVSPSVSRSQVRALIRGLPHEERSQGGAPPKEKRQVAAN